MSIKDFLEAMRQFEKRNNISTYLVLCPDESCSLIEFWKEEELTNKLDLQQMKLFLEETNYELDENGLCYSPVRLIYE